MKRILRRSARLLDNLVRFPGFVVFIIRLRKLLRKKTVAVIGGGAHMIGQGNGKVIDKHDVVLRLNFNVDEEFVEHCGARTSYYFLGATLLDKHMGKIDKIEGERIITPDKNNTFLRACGKRPLLVVPNFWFTRVFRLLRFFDREFSYLQVQKPLRTGANLLVVFWLAGIKNVSLFGFSIRDGHPIRSLAVMERRLSADQLKAIHDVNHCDPEVEQRLLQRIVEDLDATVY